MATFATPSPQHFNISKLSAVSYTPDENSSGQVAATTPADEFDAIICNTSQENESPSQESSPIISSAEKRQRENEESERLVWELMRQESMEAYRIQMEYMRENAHEINTEDLSMIELLMNEQRVAEEADQRQNEVEVEGGKEEDEEGADPDGDNDTSDIDRWDYDRLLELGNTIGGKIHFFHNAITKCSV